MGKIRLLEAGFPELFPNPLGFKTVGLIELTTSCATFFADDTDDSDAWSLAFLSKNSTTIIQSWEQKKKGASEGKALAPHCIRLICDFCSSDRGFATSFFPISPRDRHPCFSLTVPADKPASVFHRLVNEHAAHTNISPWIHDRFRGLFVIQAPRLH